MLVIFRSRSRPRTGKALFVETKAVKREETNKRPREPRNLSALETSRWNVRKYTRLNARNWSMEGRRYARVRYARSTLQRPNFNHRSETEPLAESCSRVRELSPSPLALPVFWNFYFHRESPSNFSNFQTSEKRSPASVSEQTRETGEILLVFRERASRRGSSPSSSRARIEERPREPSAG